MNRSKLVILLAGAALSFAQQTPPPAAPGQPGRGGRGGGFGGFTQPEPIDFADTTGWTSMFDGAASKAGTAT